VTDERRRRLALALMFFGAALRTWQYMARGSLWLDEAAIARNVVARSYAQLLQPLDYAQIAPKGFLLAEKLAVSTFGPSEHAFRLYAFVLSLLALPLFYRLARLVLSQRAALVALAFFAVLGRPIYYASEAKQYSGDIFFAIVLLLAAVPVARGRQGAGNAIVLGITGAIAVWFSQPAVFVLLGIALGVHSRPSATGSEPVRRARALRGQRDSRPPRHDAFAAHWRRGLHAKLLGLRLHAVACSRPFRLRA
jgi:uncharacterized membrane protein